MNCRTASAPGGAIARRVFAGLFAATWLTGAACPASAQSEIPAPFAPFEQLIGAWKGVGIPSANRLKGWPERHSWAWAFRDGQPVGLTVELEGSKLLSKGRLEFDGETKQYRLEGVDPSGKAVGFRGSLGKDKAVLTLDRLEPLPDGASQKLTLRLNSNKIRYTLWDDRKAEGAPRFTRVVDSQMGKEGESFAAGSTAGNAPKCIITGGAATLTVTYQGKSFPVCCTGCRDEFEADPEKYAKKQSAAAAKPEAKPKKSTSDDDGFDALIGDPPPAQEKPERKSGDTRTPKD